MAMRDSAMDIGPLLEALAVRQPAAPAIHAPGRTPLRYAELGSQVRYVREHLGHWGIGKGDVVVGAVPSRPEMALACATVPAATAFAPLASTLTAEVYCELLQRLRPKAFLVPAQADHPARIAARQCAIAELVLRPDPSAPAGTFSIDLAREQPSLTRSQSVPSEWALIIQTSGTTGRAKLVPVSRNRLVLNARQQASWLQFSTSDVGCHLLPLHHTLGLSSGLMLPLLAGASVVCLPESDIDGFYTLLNEHRITWLPAAFSHYPALLRRAAAFPEAVANNTLRCLRVAAGRLAPEEVERIEQTFRVPLLSAFSMTEAFTITHEPLPPGVRKRGSAGVAIDNQVAIRSETGAFCARGEIGEIVVRGPMVFDGYHDDATATVAAFADGWFRTGDLGRFDEDGYLYVVGRMKDIINRGGDKISPAELDQLIESQPGIAAACAFSVPHPTLGEELAAAVETHDGATVTEAEIIECVGRRMGPSMAPRRVYFVDRLPRTDLGKVRRSELPRMLGLEGSDLSARDRSLLDGSVPRSALETALSGLWTVALQRRDVGVHDDFFLSGGDSLRGTQLILGIKSLLGVELPLASLFGKASTIAGMAREIEAARPSSGAQRTIDNISQCSTPEGASAT